MSSNQFPVFYKNYEGDQEIIDPWGNHTGIYAPIYSDLKSTMIAVSSSKGSSELYEFGTLLEYDRTMTTSDTKCEINESSILWVDGADTDGAYNYIVKRRAPWKNGILFAIKEVTVSDFNQEQERVQNFMRQAMEYGG